MAAQLHETRMGQKLIEHDIPMINNRLKDISDEIKVANHLKREELKLIERKIRLLESK